jgi:hypothetical protein
VGFRSDSLALACSAGSPGVLKTNTNVQRWWLQSKLPTTVQHWYHKGFKHPTQAVARS